MMFDDVSWGVTAAELLKSAIDFIMIFKSFLILGLIIPFAAVLVHFFVFVIRQERGWREHMGESAIKTWSMRSWVEEYKANYHSDARADRRSRGRRVWW